MGESGPVDGLARVVNTFGRLAPEVIDAKVALPDEGMSTVMTGTPNHPFWVPAVRDYVPLGDLEVRPDRVGPVLHVQGGGEAILVSKTWRQVDFAAERSDVGESPERSGGTVRVFDFEFEGLRNIYVRGEGSDAAGVLVHNSTGPRLGSRVDLDAPDISVRSGGVDTSVDRHVGVPALAAWTTARRGFPGRAGRRVQPPRDVTAASPGRAALRPVPYPNPGLVRRRNLRLVLAHSNLLGPRASHILELIHAPVRRQCRLSLSDEAWVDHPGRSCRAGLTYRPSAG